MGDWWKQAHGIMLKNQDEFQNFIMTEGQEAFVVVDFFMPQCHWCKEFTPEWNAIVDDLTKQYSGTIKFVKFDGTSDRNTARNFGVSSYPSFLIFPPGSQGGEFMKWKTRNRTYALMKQWIDGYVAKFVEAMEQGPEIAAYP